MACLLIDFGPAIIWLSAIWIAVWAFIAGMHVGAIRERLANQAEVERRIRQLMSPPWIAPPPSEPVPRIDSRLANIPRPWTQEDVA